MRVEERAPEEPGGGLLALNTPPSAAAPADIEDPPNEGRVRRCDRRSNPLPPAGGGQVVGKVSAAAAAWE